MLSVCLSLLHENWKLFSLSSQLVLTLKCAQTSFHNSLFVHLPAILCLADPPTPLSSQHTATLKLINSFWNRLISYQSLLCTAFRIRSPADVTWLWNKFQSDVLLVSHRCDRLSVRPFYITSLVSVTATEVTCEFLMQHGRMHAEKKHFGANFTPCPLWRLKDAT